MTIDDLLLRFERVQIEKPGQWSTQCPGHDDAKNSLAVSVTTDGTILMKCQAGCSTADVLAAKGLTMRDLFPVREVAKRNGKAQLVAEYDYRDEGGALLFQAVRFEPKDFRQRSPKPGGGWEWKLNGARRVLYRLPQLLASEKSNTVFIVEGEKDCDRLAALGLTATTNVGGAGKWRDEYSDALAGYHVVILPDNDKPGRDHAEKVAASLYGNAASVKILKLDGLADKGDVSDWIAAGGTKETLIELAQAAPEWEPANAEKKPKKPAAGGSLLPFLVVKDLTDIGNAKRFAAENRDAMRYCWPWRKWLIWDERRWKEDDAGDAFRLAKESVLRLFNRPEIMLDESRGPWLKFAEKSCAVERIRAAMFLAQSEPGIPVLPAALDSDPWALNCPNGTLDLRTGELRPHRREDFVTKLCPTNFNPDAPSYCFDRFVEAIFDGNQALIDFVQRFAGYCLTGDVREHVLPIFYGTGSNGKTTYINVFSEALGEDYAIRLGKDALVVKKQEGHSTERMDLHGKRLAVCSETEDGNRLQESFVKDLTGGDTIRGRRMREDTWQYKPTHKIILPTNHKPIIRGTDHGIWRRLALVPFAVQYWDADKGESGAPELKADKTLEAKLKAESQGILAWSVSGCLDWQRNGLRIPNEVRAATKAYRDSQDVLASFLSECCIVQAGQRVKASEIYGRYRAWMEHGGEHPVSQRRFGDAMSERGFTRDHSGCTWYMGLTTRAEY